MFVVILVSFWLISNITTNSSIIFNHNNINAPKLYPKSVGSLKTIPTIYEYLNQLTIPRLFNYDIFKNVDQMVNHTEDLKQWFCTTLNIHDISDNLFSDFFRYYLDILKNALHYVKSNSMCLINCLGYMNLFSCITAVMRCTGGLFVMLNTWIPDIGVCLPVLICASNLAQSPCIQQSVYNFLNSISNMNNYTF
ncbi:uncharacterized protein LOC128960369 [Oppia nitens]|uniref:uncharacterized protein LOC128960369 n=1 Tax=Oppia nitens TaxID=1686743 RepID=UPI0023D9F4FB|nr:uncharacterized protein LOC128960369 [Oppia nitens]